MLPFGSVHLDHRQAPTSGRLRHLLCVVPWCGNEAHPALLLSRETLAIEPAQTSLRSRVGREVGRTAGSRVHCDQVERMIRAYGWSAAAVRPQMRVLHCGPGLPLWHPGADKPAVTAMEGSNKEQQERVLDVASAMAQEGLPPRTATTQKKGAEAVASAPSCNCGQ